MLILLGRDERVGILNATGRDCVPEEDRVDFSDAAKLLMSMTFAAGGAFPIRGYFPSVSTLGYSVSSLRDFG